MWTYATVPTPGVVAVKAKHLKSSGVVVPFKPRVKHAAHALDGALFSCAAVNMVNAQEAMITYSATGTHYPAVSLQRGQLSLQRALLLSATAGFRTVQSVEARSGAVRLWVLPVLLAFLFQDSLAVPGIPLFVVVAAFVLAMAFTAVNLKAVLSPLVGVESRIRLNRIASMAQFSVFHRVDCITRKGE